MIAWIRRELFLWRVRRTLRKSAKFTEQTRRAIDALPTWEGHEREWFDLVSPHAKRITVFDNDGDSDGGNGGD